MARGRGQALFLSSAEVLEDTLLPHLSAVDLMRFSLASKAISSWVLATPPALWQASQAVSCVQAYVLSCPLSTPVAEALLCAGRMPLVMPHLAT